LADSPSDQLDDACESRLNEEKDEAAVASATRDGPLGSDARQENTAKQLGRESKFSLAWSSQKDNGASESVIR
jgi:hypothetical protein